MKFITTLVFAVLLCSSVFASEVADACAATGKKLAATPVRIATIDRKIEKPVNTNRLELLQILGNSGDIRHHGGVSALIDHGSAITAALADLRSKVVALSATAESKTFLIRILDPGMEAIKALRNPKVTVSQEQLRNIAALAAALEVKS